MKFIELKRLGVDSKKVNAALKDGSMTTEDVDTLAKEQGAEIEYDKAIELVVKAVPQGGIDFNQMRKHLRILDALDVADGMLELEDSDHAHLKKLVKEHKWGGVDRNIMTFCEDIENAPVSDLRAVSESAE
ncbi:hypothetical protein LP7551_02055 [Roseibium album]|nr:hypothetical protein LP7551_02055 [Roseibium album]